MYDYTPYCNLLIESQETETQPKVELPTALYVAELNEHPETVGISIKIDTNVNHAYDSGFTPLIFATVMDT